MPAKYEVGGIAPFYWVYDRKSNEELTDYYNVTQEVNGLECDGMTDTCEEGKCQHIKAVKRYLKSVNEKEGY